MKTALPGMLWRHVALVLATVVSAHAAEDVATVIARARAHLGTDAALDAVQSLHFRGVVMADDGTTHKIEIITQRPMQQLMIETAEKVRVITALDDYTMWRRADPIEGPASGRVQLMSAQGVRFSRANVGQTLFYYRGLESIGGTVVVEDEEDIDGIACTRTVFTHPGEIRYIRFFDKTTGRLVLTRSEGGSEVRETGEMIVAGIRFPKELSTAVAGKTSRVTFEEIRVNEQFDPAQFKLPRPTIGLDPPVQPAAESEASAPETTTPASPTP